MTELEQQLQNYAAQVEMLNKENAKLEEQLRFAVQDRNSYIARVSALHEVLDRLIDKLSDR